MREYLLRAYLRDRGIMPDSDDKSHERTWNTPVRHTGHFDEDAAERTVSGMYHTMNGRKYCGEVYCMDKAREVRERYSGLIPSGVTCADVYVALNAQYHDYCELFKAWFGEDIDVQVIESAVKFWFNDDDFTENDKIVRYFSMS